MIRDASGPAMPWDARFFARVPLGIVWLDVSPTTREVYRALALRCWRNREEPDGFTIVAGAQLAREAGVSRKAALAATRRLKSRGLIRAVRVSATETAYQLLPLPADVFVLTEELAFPDDAARTRAGAARISRAIERSIARKSAIGGRESTK